MNVEDIKAAFPQLQILTDDELKESGTLMKALAHARVKRLVMPRGVGRPPGSPKLRPVIPARGRKAEVRFSQKSTNIQVAEMAKGYMLFIKCTAVKAAEVTLLELTGVCKPDHRRRLAKLISEVSARSRDRDVSVPRSVEPAPVAGSVTAMLNFYANKLK
jgi:hypothetical protein